MQGIIIVVEKGREDITAYAGWLRPTGGQYEADDDQKFVQVELVRLGLELGDLFGENFTFQSQAFMVHFSSSFCYSFA